MCAPFYEITDSRLDFLRKFIAWLEVWNTSENNVGKLTSDTFQAAVLTTRTIIDFIEYSLTVPKVYYVLAGKLQTDNLERRFGLYRSLTGCSYRISYSELIEAEKKIRIHNIFPIIPKVIVKSLQILMIILSMIPLIYISGFSTLFHTEYLVLTNVDFSANLYASGYASFAVAKRLSCSSCKVLIIKEKGAYTEDDYFDFLQRGGLSVPTDEVSILLYHMGAILQAVQSDKNYSLLFFSQKNQKGLLCTLTLKSILSDNFYINLDYECHCGSSSYLVYSHVCYRLANILLNNYTKCINNTEHKSQASNTRKVLKLK